MYRNALDKAIGRASTVKEGPLSWVVPFFSLLVKDIYFLHQGMSDRDGRGFIRFEKCMSHARLVSQMLSYKDRVVSCTLEQTLAFLELKVYTTYIGHMI